MSDEIEKPEAEGEDEGPLPSYTLSPKEIAAAKKLARTKVANQRKKALTDQLVADEMERLQAEAGMATGNVLKDDLVDIVIDLPAYVPYLSTNLATRPQIYFHGQTYRVPRHIFDDLRSRAARSWEHQAEIDGKSRQMFKERGIKISMASGAVSGAEGLRA